MRAKEPKLPKRITLYHGRYRVRLHHDGTTHALGIYDTMTDARAALDVARADVARGIFVPPAARRAARKVEQERVEADSLTLRQWSETWLAQLEVNPERSRATALSYRSVLKNHVWPELGDVRLKELTTRQVADHLGLLASRPSERHPRARVNGVAPNVVIALPGLPQLMGTRLAESGR